ncbi:Tetrapyrrole-binding protein, chloroplastic [Planktothrix tepida]|uniref:GUN4 domain-containing protein n=2 Tax=Planktothrix TaxID=54304 RepID=A0A1J1LH69_9CYAN|nr:MULTISPECIES: GUN4 domain-containing protein [Planktothrix]CAD5930740.1 Tetrapyrrole-binding protein, chloroplastic [Planktothrix tepida]CAD5979271.1 Tetrapyrrole-binding protein, chloroplastic [Planktothrix pseudagardhii]CUR31566.1 GUN4 domain-containing protein [Planktothrix tepida PCC 9214]
MSNESLSPQPASNSESQSQPLSLNSLSERIDRLEHKLDQALLLLTDLYRYRKLRDLLATENWREADEETTNIMLEIMGKSSLDNIIPDEVMNFPCSALQLLDQLWMSYSNNRFGFSVQQQIYTRLGGNDDISDVDMKVLQAMGTEMGWMVNNKLLDYEDLDFSSSAPVGCHPSGWWRSPYGAKMAVYFIARLMRCGIK